MPKYDGNQDSYIGPCTDRLIFAPVTVQDLYRTGVLLEALHCSAQKYAHKRRYSAFCRKEILRCAETIAKLVELHP